MSINPRNFGIAIGRLGRDPKVFMNRDGSKKILMSLAVRQNYKSSDGKHGVDWVDLEAFVPANSGDGVYPLLHKGIKLMAMYTVSTSTYVDANGDSQRKQALRIQSIELLDGPTGKTAGNAQSAAMAAAAAAVAAESAYTAPEPGTDTEFDGE